MRAAGLEFRPETPKHGAGSVLAGWVPLADAESLFPLWQEETGRWPGWGGLGGQARMSRAIAGWPASSSTCCRSSLLRLVISHLSPGAAAICMYFSPKGEGKWCTYLLPPEWNAYGRHLTNVYWTNAFWCVSFHFFSSASFLQSYVHILYIILYLVLCLFHILS